MYNPPEQPSASDIIGLHQESDPSDEEAVDDMALPCDEIEYAQSHYEDNGQSMGYSHGASDRKDQDKVGEQHPTSSQKYKEIG